MADNPYNEGWKAFENGIGRSDYPSYDDFSDKCSWADGWDDAKAAKGNPELLITTDCTLSDDTIKALYAYVQNPKT